jgi:hypothetical protein
MYENNNNDEEKQRLADKIDKIVNGEVDARIGDWDLTDERILSVCDGLVSEYTINKFICSPSSTLVKSNKHISEAYSNVDCRFIMTAVAEKYLNVNPADVDLRLEEMKEFYVKRNLKEYKFRNCLSNGAIDKHWGNRPHELAIMEWRWDNGLAFMDYKERVITYLTNVAGLIADAEAENAIKRVFHIHSATALLQKDFKTLSNHDIMKSGLISRSTKKAIGDFANGRLSLDKIAKDQIYRNWLESRSEKELDDEWENRDSN